MRQLLLILSFILLVNGKALGQHAFPSAYQINSDTITTNTLDSIFWQQLEDKKGKWTLNEVKKPPLSEKFHIKGTKSDGIDTTDIRTVWYRYKLKNNMTRDAAISLVANVDYFDVYIVKKDKSIKHYKTGFRRKWEEKDGLKSADWSGALPIIIAPGETVTVFERRSTKTYPLTSTSLRLLSTEKIIQQQYIEYVDGRTNYFSGKNMQEAFIVGLIFLSIFISLFFYRVVKEKVYLYFALFAFFLGINRHYNIFYEYAQWYRQDWLQYVDYIGFAWNFIPFFLIQFIRHFFILKQKYPKWDKFLYWTGVFNMVNGIAYLVFFILDQTEKISALIQLQTIVSFGLIPVGIIITSLLYVRNPNKSFRYIAYGALPLMLQYFIYSFYEIRISDFTQYLFLKFLLDNFRMTEMFCLCWLMLCFMRVLIMRFDMLRKENVQQALDKERLAKEKEMERNELIEIQKTQLETDVAERTADLKKSFEDLKATQTQLIQSEKMASLGELTAGIAHEIQNPLNFVNNFSEVSNELIDEIQEERTKNIENRDEELVSEILNDIKQNLEKINHHGKRADAIVKGMLQHSRSTSATKEPTDINKLADEYLRLAYHGLRAKDKSFNATMKTEFDETIGNINIIPQDMGRVILNLITNAFYATNEKAQQNIVGYEPTVTVSTKKVGDQVEICVKDNGNGIPQGAIDKIFQPFFTTKPTGQGTGLGLSLSYDIVKAHGGELKVETIEGEGSIFKIHTNIWLK